MCELEQPLHPIPDDVREFAEGLGYDIRPRPATGGYGFCLAPYEIAQGITGFQDIAHVMGKPGAWVVGYQPSNTTLPMDEAGLKRFLGDFKDCGGDYERLLKYSR